LPGVGCTALNQVGGNQLLVHCTSDEWNTLAKLREQQQIRNLPDEIEGV